MGIDPGLYEKYSGRKGDPYTRMGEALSQSAAQRQNTAAAKDKTYLERRIETNAKVNFAYWIVGGVIALAILIWRLI